IVTSSWQLPGGSTAQGIQVDWSPIRPGTYQATLTAVDDDGLADTTTISFTAALRPGGTFVDDNGHFAEGAIEAIAAEKITSGCNPPANDRFCPEGDVTRGQMAAFLARALKLPLAELGFFGDDDGTVFEGAIDKIAAAGITLGCNPPSNDHYCPNQLLTRAELATFLVRALHLAPVGADRFTDDNGSIFENAINSVAAAGISNGCNPPDNDRYCPDRAVKRGEMAVFLARALDLEPIYPPPAG
ncbi:MAG: S-layer homology domain-containing protein, partial [Acidimicrobiia bacterium]